MRTIDRYKYVAITLRAKCACGHEWEPTADYSIYAYMAGYCETCESPAWGIQCPACKGKHEAGH